MDARGRILDRLNRGIGARRREETRRREGTPVQHQSPEELTGGFLGAWQRNGGAWERYETSTEARLGLLLYLRELRVQQVLAWPDASLPLPGLGDALTDAGVHLAPPQRSNLDPDLTVGLTGADAALADTGSLVFRLAADRSWLPALLPIRHVVLLPRSRLLPDASSWQAGQGAETGYTLIVTGPSVSDDIELHPHQGMFGPRHLHLLLIDDL